MLYDGINLAEGSAITNMAVATGTSFPSSGAADPGELFFKTDEKRLYVYDSVEWRPASLTSGATLPSDAKLGDIFFRTVDQILYVYKSGGWVNSAPTYTLPAATASTLGGVKQGANITIAADGTISSSGSSYSLPIATSSVLGGVKNSFNVMSAGAWANADGSLEAAVKSVNGQTGAVTVPSYTLPVATASTLGGVKQGNGVAIAGDGTLSVSAIQEANIPNDNILARNADNEIITGSWTFQNTVTGVDPSAGTHLATKQYVDAVAAGLTPHASVKVATTANIATLSGLLTIDGVLLTAGDRVLVKNQNTAAQNGVYVASASAWARASDFDGNPTTEVSAGDFVYVTNGTSNSGTGWVVVTQGNITIGSTALTFSQISAAGTGVSSINASGGTTGLTFSGGPITTNGTLTLGGTLGLSAGGTGGTDRASALNNLMPTQSGNSGKFVTTDGTNISFASIPTYTLPVATASVLGGVKAGSGITIAGDGTISAAGGGVSVDSNNTWTAGQRGSVTTPTFGATTTLNLNTSNNFSFTATSSFTLANPDNIASAVGQSGLIIIKQDATGGRLISSWGSAFVAVGGNKPVLSTAPNAVDYISYFVESSTRIFVSASLDVK